MSGTERLLARLSLLSLALLLGCGSSEKSSPNTAPEDETDALYDSTHLLEVGIEMDPAAWDALREEGFSLFQFERGEAGDFDYTFFDASVTIDGQRLDNVSVRKKGGLGSLSRLRPSLIIDLNRNVSDQAVHGVSRLTLNNDRSDATHARQCMSYELFAQAGVFAPRCSLAHVTVNGRDMGTFTNVEPIRKPFLARHFEDPGGNLYEGRGRSDFTDETLDRLQIKNNEKTNDRSDLKAVARALRADDEHVVSELGKVIDLQQFRTFWAVETLTGNWDSYSGNSNNFYAYHDPKSDRFFFLPWGTDTAFTGGSVIDAFNQTLTVYANGAIANRLYNLPDERARFRSLLSDLDERLWNTSHLLTRLNALALLSTNAWPGAVANLNDYISNYSARLKAELAMPAPEWKLGGLDLRDSCSGGSGEVSGEFASTWSAAKPNVAPGNGTFSVHIKLGERDIALDWFGAVGRDPASSDPSANVQFLSVLPDGRYLLLLLNMAPGSMVPGTQPFYNFETVGFLAVLSNDTPFKLIGFVSDGAVDFEKASETPGDSVVGTFKGGIWQTSCFDLPATTDK